MQNFQITLVDMVTLDTEAKVKYLCALVRGEALRQFDILSSDMKNI